MRTRSIPVVLPAHGEGRCAPDCPSRTIIERGKGEPAFNVLPPPIPISRDCLVPWGGFRVCELCGRVVSEKHRRKNNSDPIRRLMVGRSARVMVSNAASSNISGQRPMRRRLRLNRAKACQTSRELVCGLNANHLYSRVNCCCSCRVPADQLQRHQSTRAESTSNGYFPGSCGE
ncbi:hypothetical protein BJY01DRAFT_92960 [Aspergillus pseudoustus]|uniref:Uncharacterized protein n=1 Tax=Aspergillus pseudoustus TaxID=1810923 RepID=A0ABR4J1Z4_9EURO